MSLSILSKGNPSAAETSGRRHALQGHKGYRSNHNLDPCAFGILNEMSVIGNSSTVFGFRAPVPGYQMDGYIRPQDLSSILTCCSGPNKHDCSRRRLRGNVCQERVLSRRLLRDKGGSLQ